MKNIMPDEEIIAKDTTNLFRLKREIKYTAIKDIRNVFRLEKETDAIQNRILRNIKNLFKHQGKNYYKPVRINNFEGNNYIEYEGSSDKNKTLSVAEYLDEFRPYLKDIIIDLKKFDTWKI